MTTYSWFPDFACSDPPCQIIIDEQGSFLRIANRCATHQAQSVLGTADDAIVTAIKTAMRARAVSIG